MLPNTVPEDIDKYFFNREKEIRSIKRHIESIYENLPNQILIVGDKGVGKTFLVKKIVNCFDEDILTLYIDLSNIYGINQGISEEEILKALLNGLNDNLKEGGRLDWIRERVNSFIQYLITCEYDLDESMDIFDLTIPKIRQDYSKLSKLVMELLQEIVDTSNIRGIIIVFDEFQLIEHLENPGAFLMLIRSSMKNQKNICYIYSGNIASFDDVMNIMTTYGGFGGRMPYFRIENFTSDETKRYIEEKMPELTFTDEGYDYFYKCTMGIPQYVNSFCNVLCENVIYNPDNLNKAFLENMNQIAIIWLVIWSKFNPAQKEIFKLLCDYDELTLEELIYMSKFSEEEINKALYPLLNNEHIIYDDGSYLINLGMLKLWLTNEKKTKGLYPI